MLAKNVRKLKKDNPERSGLFVKRENRKHSENRDRRNHFRFGCRTDLAFDTSSVGRKARNDPKDSSER